MHPCHFFRTEHTPHSSLLSHNSSRRSQSGHHVNHSNFLYFLAFFDCELLLEISSLPMPSSGNRTTRGEEHLLRSHASQTMSVFAHTHLSMRKNAETSQQSPIVLLQPSRWLEQLPIHRGGVASAHPVHRQGISGSPRVRSFVESTLAFLFPIS